MLLEPEQISNHITNHFKNIFSTNFVVQDLQVDNIIKDVIPSLVTNDINNMLSLLPSPAEIYNAVLAMNKDGAPGPDGFGASFYQTFWDIVKEDVIKVVLEFFTKDWILPNFNANTIVLIPKVHDATTVRQYQPIAFANFKFKIRLKYDFRPCN